MLADFSRDRIRFEIAVDQKSDKLVDVLTAAEARTWRGTDLQIEFAIFHGENLVDVSKFSSVTFEVRPFSERAGELLMSQTVAVADMNTDLDEDDWDAGTDQHGVITFTAAETNLDLGGGKELGFWFVFSAITNTVPARKVTLGGGRLLVMEDGSIQDDPVPPMGSNIIPQGSSYDATGNLVLAVAAGKNHHWTKGDNDVSVINGTETLLATGSFIAQGATITLTGTPEALITALLRYPHYLTADESDARYARNTLKVVNDPGVIAEFRSANGQWRLLLGIDDNGETITESKRVPGV